VTRAVKAIQNGKVIFVMLCSFQRPEPWQPGHQWPMPKVKGPDECEPQENVFARMYSDEKLSPKVRAFYQDLMIVRRVLESRGAFELIN